MFKNMEDYLLSHEALAAQRQRMAAYLNGVKKIQKRQFASKKWVVKNLSQCYKTYRKLAHPFICLFFNRRRSINEVLIPFKRRRILMPLHPFASRSTSKDTKQDISSQTPSAIYNVVISHNRF